MDVTLQFVLRDFAAQVVPVGYELLQLGQLKSSVLVPAETRHKLLKYLDNGTTG